MNQQINICLISGSLGIGGAEKQLFYLCKVLKSAGFNIILVSMTKGEYYEGKIAQLGINIIHLNKIRNPFLRVYKITKIVKQHNIDIIQSSHTFTNIYAGLAGKFAKRLSIGAIRSSYQYSKKDNGVFTSMMMKIPDVIFFNSQAALDETLELRVIKQEAAQLLHNVIETKQYLGKSYDNNSALRLIYVGKVQHSKGIATLLEAFKMIHDINEDITLNIVGGGNDLEHYKSISGEFNLNDSVTFHGNSNNIPELLKSADLFIFPSLSEGFPNVVIEAMAAGLPVISTPCGDVPQIIAEGKNGFVINYDSPEQIADKIMYFISHPGKVKEMGKKAVNTVEQKYDFANLHKAILNLYTKAAAYKQNYGLQASLKNYTN